MNKDELVKILKSVEIPINEGIQNDKNSNCYPRIIFWEYYWEPLNASGEVYNTKVTYQVSFFSDIPRHPKLLELLKKLHENGIKPVVEHEYVQEVKYFHSYFAVEVLENIEWCL